MRATAGLRCHPSLSISREMERHIFILQDHRDKIAAIGYLVNEQVPGLLQGEHEEWFDAEHLPRSVAAGEE